MGQLVFQATLGGAVNLVGPNTASTFNLNVPAVSSTIATLAAQTFAGTQTFTVDSVVNGLTVGRGNGAVASNTAVGASALAAVTGGFNTAFGQTAGSKITSGTENTAIGQGPMSNGAAVTGDYNTAVGTSCLYNLTSGSSNTAIGKSTLQNNTTSSNSTAVGFEAGFTQTSGADYNTFIGFRAGKSTTGDQNTFLGKFAGNLVTSGATNTIVGAYNGNQASLDIRTASNYTVISDGGGTPHLAAYAGGTVALQGAVPNAGTGITFPATQSASSNANTLDDYEEGTWTPAFGTNGVAFTSVTYAGQTGTYTKVGRLVTVSMRIEITARTVGSASGDLLITGLPFTSSNTFGYWTGSVLTSSTATNQPIEARVAGNSTTADLFYYASLVGTTNVPATSLSATAEIRLQVSYIV